MTETVEITIGDLIENKIFQKKVAEHLEATIVNRRNRPKPKEGYVYKRDWYDRLRNTDVLYSKFFLQNIQSIWEKTSSLNSETREIIRYVCDKAGAETLKQLNK